MYLASSVARALQENNTLALYNLDLVACPVQSCITKPEDCSKGHKESCEKKVDVVYEHDGHNKAALLIFRYQLKGYAREGFIKKDDLALKILIKRGIVSRETLVSA